MLHFELNEAQILVLSEALGALPYTKAAPLVQEMQRQINEQQAQTLSPTPTPPANGAELPAT